MRKGAGVKVDDKVQIELEPDLEERVAAVPEELAKVLRSEPGLRKWYDKLSPSTRRDIGKWTSEPKSSESRTRRAEQLAERLMLTMEAEKALPPVLRIAFQRQPRALEGWNAMTATQRRNHLLAIFYYRTIEGQEKRVQVAVEAALRIANKKGTAGRM